MVEPDLLVVGGGPAGISAALAATTAGLSVLLCEQRSALGGAIHRQPAEGVPPVPAVPSLAGRWADLSARLAAAPVRVLTRHAFLGIDSTDAVLVDDRAAGKVRVFRPRAVVLAGGAVERVRPRPGWHLPGVATAGGLQVMLKEGRAPKGRVLLAGSGPLLLALAAQMTAAGCPPVAVVEAGNTLAHPAAALGLLAQPRLVADTASMMMPVLRRRFAWWRGTELTAISASGERLVACLRRNDGHEERLEVDRIALHDGLRPNDFALPAMRRAGGILIERAGDVREVLGAHAAEADGTRAGHTIAARLTGRPVQGEPSAIARARTFQAALAGLFSPATGSANLADLPAETVLCRCENRTVGELKGLLSGPDALSPRELRLNGRFGMGACQGRFCMDHTLAVVEALRPAAHSLDAAAVGGHRWPLRPVCLSALADAIPGSAQAPPS
ncbi:NAD(P)/FAD-dependent oxidoreductase [Shinella zoogloeoides]|uniref:NAD(P)/FAD-dependent oxidoreductase n=1 Tax=Shinella zoogloeoides TaxID=352475 RepID=UPI00273EC5B2|nr:FAD/NAD(P)-binding oxidoreductase [Shinella zoogloeoides]WLR95550.1 FAD/NAD(P)-binding oxidoreductase [Shinella zoogloeoides]